MRDDRVHIGVTKSGDVYIQRGEYVCQKNRLGEWHLYKLEKYFVKTLEQLPDFNTGLQKVIKGVA